MLKDNVNLGKAHIYFNFQNTTHYHYFNIEEFRRPEFQVSTRTNAPSINISSSSDSNSIVATTSAVIFCLFIN